MHPLTNKPLLIYLDSQDFIRLADTDGDSEVSPIKEKLFQLRSDGVCEFGFSYLHILEVLNPDSAGFEAEQENYGKTIFDLTDGAFPYFNDVLSGERYPNDGIWAPVDILADFKNIISEKEIKKSVRDAIASERSVTRDQIKFALSKRNFGKFVRNIDFEVPPQLKLIGMSAAEFKALILDPVRHRKHFHLKLVELFSDPRKYSEVVAKVSPDANPLLDRMTVHFDSIYNSLIKLIEQHKDAMEARTRLLAKSLALKTLAKKSGLDTSAQSSLEKNIKRIGKIPSVQCKEALKEPRFAFLDTYISRVVKMEKSPTKSEVRDLLHLMYTPEVDLIRVDKRMFEMLKNEDTLRSKLVRRLEDLPEEIEKLYSQQLQTNEKPLP